MSVLFATHYSFQWTDTDLLKKIMKSHSDSTLFLKSLVLKSPHLYVFSLTLKSLVSNNINIFTNLILPFITNKELTEWN